MKWKDLWSKIIHPKWYVSVISTILTVIMITVTLILVVSGFSEHPISYGLYCLSATGLTYVVYLCVYYYKDFKNGVVNLIDKYEFSKQLVSDFGYRSLILASVSFFINTAYAIFQATMAIIYRSIWLGSLSAYYLVICFIRGWLVKCAHKKISKAEEKKHNIIYRNCGILLLILNSALIPAIILIVQNNDGFTYAGLMIYVMATYAFYKLTMSVLSLFQAKKQKDYVLQAIKNINFADSIVSILALQTALLTMFGEGADFGVANALTGAGVSMAIIGMGIYMIVRSFKNLKTLNNTKGETHE